MNEMSTSKEEIKENLRKKLCDQYVDLQVDQSCLDDWFDSVELRLIADAMDELKDLEEKNE